jgi:LAS superfamily LD-carboxypeptidase LdcB
MKDLVKEYIVDVKGEAQLRAEAQEAFARMSEEFYKEFGEKMVVVSTYRSYAYQK